MNTDVESALIIFKFSPFLRTEYPSGDKQITNIYTFTDVIKTTNH